MLVSNICFFSSRSLGGRSNLTCAYFSHQLEKNLNKDTSRRWQLEAHGIFNTWINGKINLPPSLRYPPRNKALWSGFINHWFPLIRPQIQRIFREEIGTLGGVGWPAMMELHLPNIHLSSLVVTSKSLKVQNPRKIRPPPTRWRSRWPVVGVSPLPKRCGWEMPSWWRMFSGKISWEFYMYKTEISKEKLLAVVPRFGSEDQPPIDGSVYCFSEWFCNGFGGCFVGRTMIKINHSCR